MNQILNTKFARCMRCHQKWEIKDDVDKIGKCKFCNEQMFITIYTQSNERRGR